MISIIAIIILFICLVVIYKKNSSLKLDNLIAEKQIQEIRNNFELYRKLQECKSDSNNIDIEYLNKRNAELLMENMQLKSLVGAYRNTFGNGFHSAYHVPPIPQGTIEAVKYAMKKSHPDNGGNAEDFMRFQKVYEELARK